MNISKIFKNAFLVVIFGLIVTACATKKSVKTFCFRRICANLAQNVHECSIAIVKKQMESR